MTRRTTRLLCDLTLGLGNHAAFLLEKLSKDGSSVALLACDKDLYALALAKKRLASLDIPCKILLVNDSFATLVPRLLDELSYAKCMADKSRAHTLDGETDENVNFLSTKGTHKNKDFLSTKGASKNGNLYSTKNAHKNSDLPSIKSADIDLDSLLLSLEGLEGVVFSNISAYEGRGAIIDRLARIEIKDGFSHSPILAREILRSYEDYFAQGGQVALLGDLGVSSMQLDDKSRGFSFASLELDMRMDINASLSALALLKQSSEYELANILQKYGEIRNSKQLARAIKEGLEEASKSGASFDASHLNAIAASFKHKGKLHAATLIYQALRIAVNDELGDIERLLEALEASDTACSLLVAIMTFHSLEDRPIKQGFARLCRVCSCPKEALRCSCSGRARAKSVVKKLKASREEIEENPRARSATLRIIQMYASGGIKMA